MTIKLVSAATIMSIVVGVVRRHRHRAAPVLRLRLPRHVLHVRVLRPAGLLGRRDPEVVGWHQLQRLAPRRRPLLGHVHRRHGHRRGRDRILVRRRPMAPQARFRRSSSAAAVAALLVVDLGQPVDARPGLRPGRLRPPHCRHRRRRRSRDGGLAQHATPATPHCHRGDRDRRSTSRCRPCSTRGHQPVGDLRARRDRHPRRRRRRLRRGRLRQGPVGAHRGGHGLPDVGVSCSSTGRCSRGPSTRRRR